MSFKIGGISYFLAPLFRCSSSRSLCACSFALSWALFSSAVIRGTISGNGLSNIRIVLIFGGLEAWNKYDEDSCTTRNRRTKEASRSRQVLRDSD